MIPYLEELPSKMVHRPSRDWSPELSFAKVAAGKWCVIEQVPEDKVSKIGTAANHLRKNHPDYEFACRKTKLYARYAA